ncbi:kinase-like domain-containing protein [Syncephalis fuscata]|nr:kinase-like domain-containing protein [Syncephalis fuscata]
MHNSLLYSLGLSYSITFVASSSNASYNEDSLYVNVPACWDSLTNEERHGAVAWLEVNDTAHQEFILMNDQEFTVGASQQCNCQVTEDEMPQLCFKVLVNNGIISCTNIAWAVLKVSFKLALIMKLLTLFLVNGVHVDYEEKRGFNEDCFIRVPGLEASFSICLIERTTPLEMEALQSITSLFQETIITEKRLGRGAYGLVRLGFNRVTRQRVAVKISTQGCDFSSFANEVRALNEVKDHSCFTELFDMGITSANTYISIEYAAGGDLKAYNNRHFPIPEMELKHIFKQLFEGAEQGIPGNILVFSHRLYPKVVYTDFGMAYDVGLLPRSSCCGTIPYMAPEASLWSSERLSLLERAEDNTEVYHRLTSPPLSVNGYGTPIDMWSLGAMLYYIIWDEFPYGAPNTIFNYIENILNNQLDLEQVITQASNEVVELVTQLLAIDSNARYTAEQALRCSWFGGQQEQVSTIVPLEAASSNQEEVAALATSATSATTTSTQAPIAPAATKQHLTPKRLGRRKLKRRCYSKYKTQGVAKRVQPFRKCRFNKKAF